MITRENYEIYFIDYMDGNLSERERAEVEAFLLVHPDMRELLDGMDEVRLEAPTDVFDRKERLKREVTGQEMEYFAIAAAEKVITDDERAWVAENVEAAGFVKEVELYAKLKVTPDLNCRFEGKTGLYRKPKGILFIKHYAAVAAVVALAIVVAIYTTRREEFAVEELPVTVVKTEMLPLPEVPEQVPVVEPVMKVVPRVERKSEEATEVVVERVIPVDAIELKKQVNVPVEIMAPQPSEILVSPYEGVRLRLNVKEPRERSLEIITQMEDSDNIVNNLIDVGRNVLGRIRNRDKKDIGCL